MYPPSATGNYKPPPHQAAAPPFGSSSGNHSAIRPPRVPWSSGLLDCCLDVPNCCITWLCPCITFGQIAEIVDKGSSSCWLHGAVYALVGIFMGCPCLLSYSYRSKMRKEYLLRTSPCNDCLVHCFCETCALCQEYRELTHRGYDMSMGWRRNVEKQNQEMSMNPADAPPVQGSMTR